MIDQILTYNARFVANKEYEPYVTDKFPAKKLAVLTCMDTRLTELLPKALGLRNGDAKIIKNAGGLVLSETDSAIRSLLVGIYELGVQEVMVVHHSTCGACHMSYDEFKPHMHARGMGIQRRRHLARRLPRHRSLRPPDCRCHREPSPGPAGRGCARLHHRLRNRRPDGSAVGTPIRVPLKADSNLQCR